MEEGLVTQHTKNIRQIMRASGAHKTDLDSIVEHRIGYKGHCGRFLATANKPYEARLSLTVSCSEPSRWCRMLVRFCASSYLLLPFWFESRSDLKY